MTFRAVISSLALVSAMTLSSGAFAQAMVGEMEIPADQMAAFQEKCSAINAAATETLAAPNDESDNAAVEGTAVANGEDDPQGSGNSDPASAENMEALLASMTPEQCVEAGLSPGAAAATTTTTTK